MVRSSSCERQLTCCPGFCRVPDLALQSGCREQQQQQPGRSCHPRVTGRRPRGRQRPSLGLHFPVCQAGGARRGGRRLLPSKRRRKQKSPAPPPAHSRTAPGRTRSSPARRQPGTRGAAAAPAACPMALKRIQKVSGCQGRPGCPREVPKNPGRTAWEGRGHWGGRGSRSARTGEACIRRVRVLGTRGDLIRSCPFLAVPRTPGAGARGVARLSPGRVPPRWAGACSATGGLRPLSRRASSLVSPESSFLCSHPGLPGRTGKVWWAYGLYSLSVGLGLSGLCSRLVLSGRKGLGTRDWGRGAKQKALAPAILVVLHAAATSGHIAVLRT